MDAVFFQLINQAGARDWLDLPMAVASSWDFWWPFLLGAGLLVLIFGGFRSRCMLVVIGLTIGITDGLVVDTIKGAVGRPRPNEVVAGSRTVDLEKVTPRVLALARPVVVGTVEEGILPRRGNSFPSGHAANNFALAMVVTVFYRRWGWLMFLPAAVVAYSRVYVGAHWPLDVLVSALLGAGIALLVCAAVDRLWRRFAPKWFPSFCAKHPEVLRA